MIAILCEPNEVTWTHQLTHSRSHNRLTPVLSPVACMQMVVASRIFPSIKPASGLDVQGTSCGLVFLNQAQTSWDGYKRS